MDIHPSVFFTVSDNRNNLILEKIQYNAALAITGAIRGTSKEKLYQELGLESLQLRRWYHKIIHLYKILKNQSPRYLYDIIPTISRSHTTRTSDNIFRFRENHFS